MVAAKPMARTGESRVLRTVRQAPAIRVARDDDEAGLVALIGGCFAEYPGCLLDVDGEIPELRAVATTPMQPMTRPAASALWRPMDRTAWSF